MATETFIIEAGLLVRRSVIAEVTSGAWELGLECTHERAGCSIRFKVEGDQEKIRRLMSAVRSTIPAG